MYFEKFSLGYLQHQASLRNQEFMNSRETNSFCSTITAKLEQGDFLYDGPQYNFSLANDL